MHEFKFTNSDFYSKLCALHKYHPRRMVTSVFSWRMTLPETLWFQGVTVFNPESISGFLMGDNIQIIYIKIFIKIFELILIGVH